MSDVTKAQALLWSVWEPRKGIPAKTRIGQIFEALKRVERKLATNNIEEFRGRQRQWTARRVETIWAGTARRLDHYELVDLEKAALEAARAEHQESIERSRRLEIFISSAVEAEGREMA